MPGTNGSDGSIIIDTGLDTKGFDKGSQQLLHAINSLTQEINRLGQTIQNTFSNYASVFRDSNANVTGMQDSVTGLDDKVQGLNSSVDDLQSKLKEVGNQQVTPTLETNGKESEVNTDASKQAVTSLEQDIANLSQSMQEMGTLAEAAMNGDSEALMKFESQAEQVEDTVESLTARLEEFGNSDITPEEYKQVTSEIDKTKAALEEYANLESQLKSAGVSEDSAEWGQLQTEIDKTNDHLLDYIAKKAVLEANGNIDTGLGSETEEYDKMSESLSDIMSQLYSLQDEVYTSFDSAGDAVDNVSSQTEELDSNLTNVEADAESAGKAVSNAMEGASGETQDLQTSAQEAEGAVKDVQSSLEETAKVKATPTFNVDPSEKAVSSLEKGINGLGKTVEGMSKTASAAMDGDAKAMSKFEGQSEKAEATLSDLRQQLEAFGNTKFQTSDYKWLNTEIEKAEKSLEKLLDRQAKMEAMGTKTNSKSWKSLQYEIDQAKLKLGSYMDEKAMLEQDGEATFSGINTEQYAQYSDLLSQIETQLSDMQSDVQAAFEPPDTSRWGQMTTLSGMIRNSFVSTFNTIRSGAVAAGTAVATVVMHPIQSLDRLLGFVVSSAGRAAVSLARLAGNAIVSGIKRIGSAAKSAAGHLLSMARNAASSAFKNLSKNLSAIGRSSRSANKGLGGSLKTILKYTLGIRSLFVLVNKIRSALVEGFKEIAKADPGFNAKISEFMTALSQLKYSLASAFAPIAEIVMPILTRLMTIISEVLNRFGQLTAALAGKSSYMKAVAVQKDYAKSLEKSTSSTKKNTKATKENQRTIAGFDDVQILKSDDKDEEKEQSPYESSPIESAMSDVSDWLKNMWKDGDFTELGRKFGEKLKVALESIPWSKIKATLRKIAKSIATFLNGFLETPGLFTVIGKTIAEAINSAFEFVESFVSNFHWASLGHAIRNLVLGVVNNIDWSLIYKTMMELGRGIGLALETALDNPEIWTGVFTTISKGLNSILYGLNAFLTAVDWGSIAAHVGNGLNDGMKAFNWDSLGDLLINAINGVFDIWYNFITTFDFKKFGEHIGEQLSRAIKEINWSEGGASVGETINALFYALSGFVEQTDWKALGVAVINAIAGFFGSIDWSAIGTFISDCIKGLFDALSGAIGAINWAELPGKIVNAFGEFLSSFDWDGIAKSTGELIGAAFKALVEVGSALWKTMKQVGKNIIDGGLEGIIDTVKNIGSWIKEHIFDPFVKGFKSAFGIASPAKEMKPFGRYIIEGALSGMSIVMSPIGSWIKEHIFTPFTNKFKSLFGIVSSASSVFKKYGESLMSGLKNGSEGKKSLVTNAMQTIATDIKGKFNNQNWDALGGFIGDGIHNGLFKKAQSLATLAWNTAVNMYNKACEALGIHSPSRKFFWVAEMMIAGLTNGITDSQDNAIDAVSSLASAVTKEAESATPLMTIDTATNGVDEVLNTFSDKIVGGFEALIATLENIANGASFITPAMANGTVTPYSMRKDLVSSAGDSDLERLVELLEAQDDEHITVNDLKELLIDMFTRYMNIQFYMGDTDVARIANRGNEKLKQRFSTT